MKAKILVVDDSPTIGADDYIIKPFSDEGLIALIEQHLT
jgi:FixJ family two-component response regulator